MSRAARINARDVLNLDIPGVRILGIWKDGDLVGLEVETDLPRPMLEEVITNALTAMLPEGMWATMTDQAGGGG